MLVSVVLGALTAMDVWSRAAPPALAIGGSLTGLGVIVVSIGVFARPNRE